MKSHVRVVVIGGGVVGASVLYHLTKMGWTDAMLLEKHELTSGSTWHAAASVHTYNSDANVSKLQKYTIDLYREIEAISGQSCGIPGAPHSGRLHRPAHTPRSGRCSSQTASPWVSHSSALRRSPRRVRR